MAWSVTKNLFGVCGNFRYAFYTLTDIKATRSLFKPEGVGAVKFCKSTNLTDNTDVLLAQILNWTGTQDSTTAGQLNDASEVFESPLNGLQIFNTETADGDIGKSGLIEYSAAAKLLIDDPQFHGRQAPLPDTKTWEGATFPTEAYSLFNATETFSIINERVVQVLAGDADDDGTIFVMGR